MENICVCTDAYSNHVTALISVNRAAIQELSQALSKQNVPLEQLCQDTEVIGIVFDSLRSTGARLNLSAKEMPQRITLLSDAWTTENNLLTAALKLRRKQVTKKYETEIRAMFDTDGI